MLIGLTDDFALFNSWVRLTAVFSEQPDFTGEADCPQVDLLASFPSVGIQARSGPRGPRSYYAVTSGTPQIIGVRLFFVPEK